MKGTKDLTLGTCACIMIKIKQRVVGSNPTQGSSLKKKIVLGIVQLFAVAFFIAL